MNLLSLFDRIVAPERRADDRSSYSVRSIPGFSNFLVGRDADGHACLLIADRTSKGRTRLTPAIQLSNLEANFGQTCVIQSSEGQSTTESFAVVRCRANDSETIMYFLWVCETLVQIVGAEPNMRVLSAAVIRLAAMFQQLQQPPSRPLNGLFGEVYVMWASADVARALSMWRQDVTSRFDFSGSDIRLEVKVTAARIRSHTFSYEQCNPPGGTIPVVASMLIERINGGVALGSLVNEIINRLGTNHELVFKFQEGIAETLGNSLEAALKERFDTRLARHTLKFFQTTNIPAVRGVLEAGVSNVHFTADLSGCIPASRLTLLQSSDELRYILPPDYAG